MLPSLAVVCLLTFVHYAAAQMRTPIIPLYASAHGATATGVGVIVAAHMAAAGLASIPCGRAADVRGRRPLIVGGILVGAVTSALFPLVDGVPAMAALHGLAGIGIAAFSPSLLSLVGDVATPGKLARAFAWYSTAHYGAIGIGPFIGGVLAGEWSHGAAFVGSAVAMAFALTIALATLRPERAPVAATRPTWSLVRGNRDVWAGWTLGASGLCVQGVVFTFLPLLAQSRGTGPAAIGLVFLVLGLANTAARVPAGWVLDRSGRTAPYAIGGIAVACALTVVVPNVEGHALLALVAVFGALSGGAFVAVGVGLTAAAPMHARGLVMGGYSTALYLGLGLGSLATGPVIARAGYEIGFAIGGLLGMCGVAAAALIGAGGSRRVSGRA